MVLKLLNQETTMSQNETFKVMETIHDSSSQASERTKDAFSTTLDQCDQIDSSMGYRKCDFKISFLPVFTFKLSDIQVQHMYTQTHFLHII